MGILTSKSIELVQALYRRKVNIACIQETKWVGAKAREIDGYKLWYSSGTKVRNGVGILVEKELIDRVVEVRRKSDRIMYIKLVLGAIVLDVISVYAPQMGLTNDIKRFFGRSWKKFYKAYLGMRNFSWEETLMDILVRRPMGILERTGVSGLELEIVEEWHF